VSNYDVILADPPWRYDFSRSASRAIERQYPTMTPDELKAIPVGEWAAPDSVLFLWATAPKLPLALEVMATWGFTYRTNAVWDKGLIGMGYYFRGQHEHLLIGNRGKPRLPVASTRQSSVIHERRTRHSAKPVAAYEAIEGMYPHARKLELFARAGRNGWDAWGNEAPQAIRAAGRTQEQTP
jgi:N6-adenosine-specific RNA methylase IME4